MKNKTQQRRSLRGRVRTHGLPTGDICDALRERGDDLSVWAAQVIQHLRKEKHKALCPNADLRRSADRKWRFVRKP